MQKKHRRFTGSWKQRSCRFILRCRKQWARLMRTTLAFNGSYFNTNRMVKQYTRNSYYPMKMTEAAKVEEEAYAD